MQALRGRESSVKAKWQNEGWDLVSENRGPLRTDLYLRRVKPKTTGSDFLSHTATLRRVQPRTRFVLVASFGLILVAGIIGIAVGTPSEGDTLKPNAGQRAASGGQTIDTRNTTSTAESAESTVTDVTVSVLAEMVNAGGPKLGDQFRVTGELVGSEYWTTGASGDFFVMLETPVGSDLEVFIDESAASGWQDGTKVEMILKAVDATIDGETTGGWLEVQSARTISG